MIKTVTVCQCDFCGRMAKAKPVGGRYNETEYVMPDGWQTGPNSDDVHFCSECVARLNQSKPYATRRKEAGTHDD